MAENQNSNLFTSVVRHPTVIAIGCVLMLMVLVLLVGLLIVTRSKRQRSAEIKRLNAALIEAPPINMYGGGGGDDGAVGQADGVDNVAYEIDIVDMTTGKISKQPPKPHRTGKPVLYFPEPPASSPTSRYIYIDISSICILDNNFKFPTSSSTSDSSVYYTKRRSRLDIQNILEEKAVNLFQKKSSIGSNDPTNALYASIAKKKKRKQKLKRKYLSENRVGSVEGSKLNSSQSSSGSDAFDITSKTPHYYEPVEAINPNVVNQQQYHRNKLLHSDNVFTIRPTHDDDDDEQFESPTEAYNRDILRALQQRDSRSPGAGSIGSFLSMVSVRSFPKCSVPEPLSRVLEPLSVMHFDQSDDGAVAGLRRARIVDTIGKGTTIADIEQRTDGQLYRSQSDGADPGVIGPVVWEIHKKQIDQNCTRIKQI